MKLAVLLLNFGSPDSEQAVRPFLYNLFKDPGVLPLPFGLRHLLAWRISTKRAPTSAKNYKMIGNFDQLNLIINQGQQLENELKDEGEVKCFPAMNYWHPFIKDVVKDAELWGAEKIISLPLTPQYCRATTGSVLAGVRKWVPKKISLMEIKQYYKDEDFINAQRDVIENELKNQNADRDTTLLFSAHGLPQSFVDDGDPYISQIEESIPIIMEGISYSYEISFQSRVGKAKWYGITTLQKISELAKSGVKNLMVIPISFTSENIETLHELDIEVKEHALHEGITNYMRVPTVNSSEKFIPCMANIIRNVLN